MAAGSPALCRICGRRRIMDLERRHPSICRLQTHAASVASIRSRRSHPKPLVTALSQKASMTAETLSASRVYDKRVLRRLSRPASA